MSITVIQRTALSSSEASSPISMTVTSTGTGHFGVLLMESANGNNCHINTVSDGTSTWVTPAGAYHDGGGGTGTVSGAYTLLQASGKTTLTVNLTNPAAGSCQLVYYECSFTSSAVIFADAQSSTSASANPVAGQSVTVTANSFIAQGGAFSTGNPVSINGAYGNIQNVTGFCGAADAENTIVGSAPSWTMGAANSATVNAIAISESAPVNNNIVSVVVAR